MIPTDLAPEITSTLRTIADAIERNDPGAGDALAELGRSIAAMPAATLSEADIDLLRHALGVQKRGKKWSKPYRNHFVAAGENVAAWERMVELGFAEQRHAAAELTGGDPLFIVTELGRSAALAKVSP